MSNQKLSPLDHSGRCLGIGLAALLSVEFGAWPDALTSPVLAMGWLAILLSVGWAALARHRAQGD